MIEEGMSDKEKEIIRAMWPGIFMRPKRDGKGLLTQDDEDVKFTRNVLQGP